MKIFICLLVGIMFIFSSTGCERAVEVERTSLGKIVDADVIPTSFNESVKMKIKTEKSVIIIHRIISVDIGKESWRIDWSDGHRSFGWEGSKYAYRY